MKKDDGAPRRSVAGGRHQALDAAVSSYAANASRIASRTAFCPVVSTTGRSRAKLRRSPLIAYCRAGNVTLRPAPVRRSQIPKRSASDQGTDLVRLARRTGRFLQVAHPRGRLNWPVFAD